MATVIDSLIVELGLDPAKFTQGQKSAMQAFNKARNEAERHAKAIEASGARAVEFFQKLKREALGLVAALVGGTELKQFVTNITNTDAAVGRLAKTMDLPPSVLIKWRNAAKLWGGSEDSITNVLRTLKSDMKKLELGIVPDWLKYLNQFVRLDITKVKDADELLLTMADAMKSMDPARARVIADFFHIDNDTLVAMLKGRKGLQEFLDTAQRLNPVTDEQVRLAIELQKAWNETSLAAEHLGRVITTVLLPPLTKVLESMTKFLEKFPGSLPGAGMGLPLGAAGQRSEPWSFSDWLKAWIPGDILKGRGVPGRALEVKPSGGAESSPGGAVSSPSSLLRTKSGAGDISFGMLALATSLQNEIPGILQFTAFDDLYHKGRRSKHPKGLALDFSLRNREQSAAVSQQIREKLKAMGIDATVLDAYLHPEAGDTGPHIHVQFNSAAGAARFSAMNPVPASSAASNVVNRTSTNTSDVKIGNVIVNTQATDAQGIARDIKSAIEKHGMAAQANTGLE